MRPKLRLPANSRSGTTIRRTTKHQSQRAEAKSASPGELKLTCELPPSTNALYQTRRGGTGKALTKVAKKFREDVKKLVSKRLPELLTFPVDDETVYVLEVTLYFEALENPGWFEFWNEDKFYTKDIRYRAGPHKGKIQFAKGELKARKGERKAKSRYKVIDYDNRIKFLQDCMVAAIGIPNDSQIFRGVQEKREDKENPRAEIVVRVTSRDQFFKERR